MERVGTITSVKEDTAVVAMRRHVSCASCGRCGAFAGKPNLEESVEVINPIKAGIGQKVLVETNDRQMLFISFMLYMVPLAALLAGVLLWVRFAPALGFGGNQEPAAAGAGFLLMVLVYLGIRIWDRRVKGNPRYKPVIVDLAREEE